MPIEPLPADADASVKALAQTASAPPTSGERTAPNRARARGKCLTAYHIDGSFPYSIGLAAATVDAELSNPAIEKTDKPPPGLPDRDSEDSSRAKLLSECDRSAVSWVPPLSFQTSTYRGII